MDWAQAGRIARRPLVMAGPVQPGQEDYFRRQIEPHIDGRRVRYVGEVTGLPRQQLFAGAAALLMPIRWDEPFGMVIVEALATGTPVIAFPEGAAGEIVIDGYNGRLVDDVAEMAEAVRAVDDQAAPSRPWPRAGTGIRDVSRDRLHRASPA
jgi:glycosyltransferase involved in cell wall biosynthesis